MKNILNKLSNVIITIVVALIVYCVCVPSPANATCKDAVRVDTYSYNNNFVECFCSEITRELPINGSTIVLISTTLAFT